MNLFGVQVGKTFYFLSLMFNVQWLRTLSHFNTQFGGGIHQNK